MPKAVLALMVALASACRLSAEPVQFTSGDECLFCHRMDIGPTWANNRHGQTVRLADPQHPALASLSKDKAEQVELLLGHGKRTRYLKRSSSQGQLELLVEKPTPHWDSGKFGDSCAGCHATGVDSRTRTFATHSLDCFACHGEPSDKHTTKGELVVLSPHRRDSAAVITSACAQCHLRTGKSKSTGLPYPNHFVAGGNLFPDFQIDLSDEALAKLNPGDRHVQENVRDVVLRGKESVTCLSCHDVHKQSSRKHHRIANGAICLNCHQAGSKKDRIPYEVHSTLCEY